MNTAKKLDGKITCEIVLTEDPSADLANLGREAERAARAYYIRRAMLDAGHKGAVYARELGVTRGAVYQVINGKRNIRRIREHIETRLGHKFWS